MNVRVRAVLVAVVGVVGGCGGGGAAPKTAPVAVEVAAAATNPCALPAGSAAQASVHLDTMRPGEPMGVVPDHWRIEREEMVGSVRAEVLTWPGNALGVVVVRDDPQRCVLGTWVLAFGGLGVELADWRMAEDASDGYVHIRMAYVATYNNPIGEDGAEERGTTELRSDGRTAELVRTEGYADFE